MESILKRNDVKVIGNGKRNAHGFGGAQNVWKYIQDSFLPDYQLVLSDYLGSGRSDLSAYDSKRYSSLDGYSQDVLEICEALNIDSSVFVGHSVSSMIGALAAIEMPKRFEKPIFIGPSPRYINDGD